MANMTTTSDITINFRKFGPLVVNTTTLPEGITSVTKKLSHTDIQAVISRYGDYVIVTDQILRP